MKTIITIHLALVLLALLVFVAGLILPRRKETRRTITLNAVPEEIWDFITNIGRFARWRSDLREVKILEQTPDVEMWTEYPKNGTPLTFKTHKKVPYRTYEIARVDNGLVGGHRLVELSELDRDTTQVTFAEYAEIRNPFKRVLAHLYVDFNANVDQFMHDVTTELARRQERMESQTS